MGDVMLATFGIVILVVFSALPVRAVYLEVVEAFIQGDYETAYRDLAPFANSGEAEAQLFMGIMEQNGFGAQKNLEDTANWYQLAGSQGNPDAQYNLALLYGNGLGVPLDHSQSAAWLRKAAEQGHAETQYRLGMLLIAGQGVSQDVAEAAV
tara:strand:+ start:117 stop:572 length:456 start_codon:yes stop_codon:yes gene_type:complete